MNGGLLLGQLLPLSAADPTRLYLQLLGEVALFQAGQKVASPGPKLLALLAYLHLHGPASREELAEVFWAGKGKGGLQNVRQALTQLRKQQGAEGWLIENAQGIALASVSEVGEFRRLAALGQDAEALAVLGSGELLSALASPSATFSNWLEEEKLALSTLHVEVLRRHGAQRLAQGDFACARETLAQAQQLEPYSEDLYRTLMTLEHQAGDTARALEVFEACRQMLHRELQATPSPETLALLRQIEAREAGSNQRGQLLTQAADLPQTQEPLFGREVGRQRLLALLEGAGRVLLHGLGGLGKTRLASAVAVNFLNMGQKVIWLEVGGDSAEDVLTSVREVLRLRPNQNLETGFTAENVGLIVLDNAANTYAMQQVLATLPRTTPVLVTSRLRLPGVKALELTRLNRESALQLLQHHLAGEARSPAVNQEALCALLGDHPFALRLAALTLAHGGTDMMPALYASPHDTIRTLLEQSLSGVSAREYEVFLALGSLYAPQATPELLSVLLNRPQKEVEDALQQLMERGLLSRESRAGSDTLCFRMHDLTWHAARERRAHLPHHLVAAVTDYAQSNAANPDLLSTDLPHLLGAAGEASVESLTRLMAGWLGGGYIGARGFPTTALHLLERATEHAATSQDWETASLLGGKHADIAQALLGNQSEAISRLLKAAQQAGQAGNRARQAVQLALAGQMEAAAGNPEAWNHLRAAQELAHQCDAVTEARVLGQVAMAHAYRKEFAQAHSLLSRARAMLRADLADSRDKAVLAAYLGILGNLGQAEKRLGNLQAALELKQEMAQLAAEKDERLYQARAALDQGELLNELGRPDEAMTQLRQAITISQSIGSGSLEGMARRLLQDIASAN